ncbi:MAG: 50S ribosomal protein L32 [Pseudonocardia sp.]|nr:50S ribosomal protein L32 [Pseudonocardia sp.]
MSRSRTRHRRSKNMKLTLPDYATCSRCKEMKPSHIACPYCGHYNGREYPEAIVFKS